jgi:hypothetical protein
MDNVETIYHSTKIERWATCVSVYVHSTTGPSSLFSNGHRIRYVPAMSVRTSFSRAHVLLKWPESYERKIKLLKLHRAIKPTTSN